MTDQDRINAIMAALQDSNNVILLIQKAVIISLPSRTTTDLSNLMTLLNLTQS